jgi:Cys-tRNA(Pro) deacylase
MTENVEGYLHQAGVDYKIHRTHTSTITARDAATELQVPLQTIIKSILFTDETGLPILAILTGDKRVDRNKLACAVGVKKTKIASPHLAESITGFEVGTMPPFGHARKIVTVIDQEVMSLSRVYGGSGTLQALIEISPRDLARLTEEKVADICE